MGYTCLDLGEHQNLPCGKNPYPLPAAIELLKFDPTTKSVFIDDVYRGQGEIAGDMLNVTVQHEDEMHVETYNLAKGKRIN